jgi:hypothetical protein
MGSSGSKHVEHSRIYMAAPPLARSPSSLYPTRNASSLNFVAPKNFGQYDPVQQFTTTMYPRWMINEDDVKDHAQQAVPVYIVYTKSQVHEMMIKFIVGVAISAIAALISGIAIIHYAEYRKKQRFTVETKIKKLTNPTTFEATIGAAK